LICRIVHDEKPLMKLFLLPSIWVGLEYTRGHALSGFDWVSLGHSQYKNLVMIQIADITGMLGVSFIVVMVNYVIKEMISLKLRHEIRLSKNEMKKLVVIVLMTLICVFGYGAYQLTLPPYVQSSLKVAVIQGNIEQDLKWDETAWPMIMQKHLELTKQAALEKPDLIIWPETSFPGHLWEDVERFDQLKKFVHRLEIPLLFGAVVKDRNTYHNSAILLSAEGFILQKYDKLHLVPFGEYLPLRKQLPFLSSIVPIADFTAGNRFTRFPLKNEGPETFSVLICFEDTVSRLSREFVQRGAQFLVNITNDAWFKDTKEPFLHLQSSVFRTIENRRSLIRSANTGVSCYIDAKGRIIDLVKGPREKTTYVTGYSLANVGLFSGQTFYSKFGDVFTYMCIGCILFCALLNSPLIKRKRL